jgi:hypothetical protein
MSSDSSGIPLAKKLGVKEGQRFAILGAPKGYRKTLGVLPPRVAVSAKLIDGMDLIQIFVTREEDLKKLLPASKGVMKPAGAVWVSWRKHPSGIQNELRSSTVRQIGLESGLVDVKVCSIDDTWSGLKFVIRVKDRQNASVSVRSR